MQIFRGHTTSEETASRSPMAMLNTNCGRLGVPRRPEAFQWPLMLMEFGRLLLRPGPELRVRKEMVIGSGFGNERRLRIEPNSSGVNPSRRFRDLRCASRLCLNGARLVAVRQRILMRLLCYIVSNCLGSYPPLRFT